MVTRPDEPYYTRQYLHWILPEISLRYLKHEAKILDLGCGQGRLSLPLAEWLAEGEGRITGVDFTSSAIEKARSYAKEQGLDNISFVEKDLLDFIRKMADSSIDAILFIEVIFILPSYRKVLEEISRVLQPKGLAFIAFRSQYYNLLYSVRSRRWKSANTALRQSEGNIFGGPSWFSWQTPREIRQLLNESGLRLVHLRGIGVFSGIEGDPLASVARPSELSEEEQNQLMKMESHAAEDYAACGRYILATVEKK